ncbi:hypothetical protein [Ferrimonas lipolytica]|uniref:Uncharacterized protein n=1 Tax=Ferrimonas lipolytica TaxID=2724191 RepID=A0A6H1UC99_9GAMM|nr:hypothetical protein [Ferrimonas lipolytica]QIZ76269.1 hypothetical protein HER31_04800 [Ferrimonas lipolytica]
MNLPTNSRTIFFNILNAAATQLPGLHNLSDAGAGADLMHLTPTRDSEMIVAGAASTLLPGLGKPSALVAKGLLDNGGISPSVLTHGLLQALQQAGFTVAFRSYNFGVQCPDAVPQPWWQDCQHFGGIDADTDTLITEQLIPNLTAQAKQGINIIAECGVGGTTFSTFWLRLLTGLPLSPAGSTTDPDKLRKKAHLLAEIEQSYAAAQAGFCVDTLLADRRFHDPIQRSIYRLLRAWPEALHKPILAGGMMFIAPLLAAAKQGSNVDGIDVATTRWVMDGEGAQVMPFLPNGVALGLNQTDFNQAKAPCLHRYEQGQVVEGCGLGGCLVLAEQLGLSSAQIIAALDHAAAAHIDRISKSNHV